jgi:hypothetical protein
MALRHPQEFDFETAVEIRFFEDLTYRDVAPALDAFADTTVFNVRGNRDGWSGPAAGGPEIGLIITAIATVGGAAFVGSFFSELGKDAYRGVRAAILATVHRLRSRERRRAVVALAIHVQNVSVCFGSVLDEELRDEAAADDEWTDDWFVARLREAQTFVDRYGSNRDEPLDDRDCRHWLK